MTLQRFVERLIWLCMLPPILLGAALVFIHVDTLEERRQMLADSVAHAAAQSVDQLLEVRLASLILLGRVLEDEARSHDGALNLTQARRIANQYLNLHGQHVLVGTADRRMLLNTRIPAGIPLPDLPVPVSHSAVSLALVNQSAAVGDVFIGPIAKAPLVAIAVPLLGTDAQPLVVLSTVEVLQFKERLSGFMLPPTWRLVLRDATDRVLVELGESDDDNPPQVRSGPEDPDQPAARLAKHHALLNQAPWRIELTAPASSPLDDRLVQTALLLITLGATVAVAYGGGRLASGRLPRAMQSLITPAADPPADEDIDEVAQVRRTVRDLTRQRENAQEQERRRIGLELHDDLQQRLALLRHELDGLKKTGRRRLPASGAWVTANPAQQAMNLVDETIESTRRLVQDLRPPALEEGDLPAALQALADQQHRLCGQVVEVQVIGMRPWHELSLECATGLYRIAQEALNNARKHAHATHVHICLDASSNDHWVLEISDDGVGLIESTGSTVPAVDPGNGLHGMRERAKACGGALEILSHPGEGTAVVVQLPVTGGNKA